MKPFGQLIRTVVNTAVLPLEVMKDSVMLMADAGETGKVGQRTLKQLRKLADEAGEDA